MSSTRGHDRCIDGALRELVARCGGPDPPTPVEVEDALERGFAALMSLEAQLQRVARSAPQDVRSHEALGQEIVSLRSALEDLREHSAPDHTSPLALGFVFPSRDE